MLVGSLLQPSVVISVLSGCITWLPTVDATNRAIVEANNEVVGSTMKHLVITSTYIYKECSRCVQARCCDSFVHPCVVDRYSCWDAER